MLDLLLVVAVVLLTVGVLGPLRRSVRRSRTREDAGAVTGQDARAVTGPVPGPVTGAAAPVGGGSASSGPGGAVGPLDPRQEAVVLQGELTALVRRVNAAGGRLPVAAVPAVRAVEDVLRPLLRYVAEQSASPAEAREIAAMVRDHLPSAVDHYLALPPQYAASATNASGRTPAQELVDQLHLLAEGAGQVAQAVYDSDAEQLAVGRRFLDSKFRRSDLDL